MNRQFANAARIATPLEANFTGDRVTPPGFCLVLCKADQ